MPKASCRGCGERWIAASQRTWSSAPLQNEETAANYPCKTAQCDERHCVAAPANRERRRAAAEETELVSCVSPFCGSSQNLGSTHAESLTGLLEQFLGNGEIHQCRVDVLVAEVCRQVRETRLRVDAF